MDLDIAAGTVNGTLQAVTWNPNGLSNALDPWSRLLRPDDKDRERPHMVFLMEHKLADKAINSNKSA